MTSPYWAKLWIEILDDPKVANMPDWLFRRFIYFVLAAKEYDSNGLLQPVNDLAWRLRIGNDACTEALEALSKIGVARETAEGWELINFVKRQEREYSDTPDAIRQRKHREKEDVTKKRDTSISVSSSVSVSDSSSDSLTESNIFKLYANEVGLLTPMIADELKDAEKEYPEDYVIDAIHEAVRRNKRSWGYILSILKTWKAQGFKTIGSNGKGKRSDYRDTPEARAKYAEID